MLFWICVYRFKRKDSSKSDGKCRSNKTYISTSGDDPTYKVKGSKQVLIHKKNKKRAFTCVTSVTATAEVLATQNI